ncbi:hypothetical protein [Mucilaginibacter metallidurans]|nr:hypothetical protein [Mucilaginibacter gossypii]
MEKEIKVSGMMLFIAISVLFTLMIAGNVQAESAVAARTSPEVGYK